MYSVSGFSQLRSCSMYTVSGFSQLKERLRLHNTDVVSLNIKDKKITVKRDLDYSLAIENSIHIEAEVEGGGGCIIRFFVVWISSNIVS